MTAEQIIKCTNWYCDSAFNLSISKNNSCALKFSFGSLHVLLCPDENHFCCLFFIDFSSSAVLSLPSCCCPVPCGGCSVGLPGVGRAAVSSVSGQAGSELLGRAAISCVRSQAHLSTF